MLNEVALRYHRVRGLPFSGSCFCGDYNCWAGAVSSNMVKLLVFLTKSLSYCEVLILIQGYTTVDHQPCLPGSCIQEIMDQLSNLGLELGSWLLLGLDSG